MTTIKTKKPVLYKTRYIFGNRGVRCHNPVTDGYSIIVAPCQEINLILCENIIESDIGKKIYLDSDFFILKEIESLADGKTKITYQPKHDLTPWIKLSTFFLGEIFYIVSKTNTIRIGIYLKDNNIQYNNITVINPKFCQIKAKYGETINFIFTESEYYDTIVLYQYDKYNAELRNTKYSEVSLPNIENYDVNFNNVKKLSCTLSPCDRTDRNVCSDTCQVVNVKIKGKNRLSSILTTCFAKVLLSVKVKDISKSLPIQRVLEEISKRELVDNGKVLINPTDGDSLDINHPNISAIVEIVEPALLYKEFEYLYGIKWHMKLEGSIGYNQVTLTGVELKEGNVSDRYGQKYTIQRFLISVKSEVYSHNISSTFSVGRVVFYCQDDKTKLKKDKTIKLWYTRFEKCKNYSLKHQSVLKRGYSYTNNYQWNNPDFQSKIAKVDISLVGTDIFEKSGSIKLGTVVSPNDKPNLSMYRQDHTNVPQSNNVLKKSTDVTSNGFYNSVVPVHAMVPEQIRLTNDISNRTYLEIKSNDLILIEMTSDYAGDSIESEAWSCNIYQEVLRLHLTTAIKICNSVIKYKFEIKLCDFNLPTSIQRPYYVGCINLIKGAQQKYIYVYIKSIHPEVVLSKPIKLLCSNKIAFEHISNSSPLICDLSKDGQTTSVVRWHHNTCLVLSPDKNYNISLPKLDNGDSWNINLKQYSLPNELWKKVGNVCDDSMKDAPWWPDDLCPENACESVILPSVIEFQNNFYALLERLHEYYDSTMIPLGELFISSSVDKMSIENQGTLYKINQKCYKRIYIYAEYFSDSVSKNNGTKNKNLNVFNNPIDCININVQNNDDLRIRYDGTGVTLLMFPPWLNLYKTSILTSGDAEKKLSKEFSFTIVSNPPKNWQPESWLYVTDGNGKDKKLRITLEKD